MTAIDERDSISGDHTAASFEEVIAYGLDHDAVGIERAASQGWQSEVVYSVTG